MIGYSNGGAQPYTSGGTAYGRECAEEGEEEGEGLLMARKWLVVGDAHFEPGQSLERACALGNAALEERPDGVIVMGDWVSMNSLSTYDKKGGVKLEGTRIKDDVQIGLDALRLVTAPGERWSARQRGHKHKTWRPTVHYIEGNHEFRIVRWWEDDAQVYGTYALPEIYGPQIESYTVYSDYLWLDNIGFTHVPFNKVGPISTSGITTSVAQKAVVQSARSIVFGHTHIFDVGRTNRVGDERVIYALNVGCFFEPEHDPAYMTGRLKDWWRGVVWLDTEPDGTFDFQTVELSKFKARYT